MVYNFFNTLFLMGYKIMFKSDRNFLKSKNILFAAVLKLIYPKQTEYNVKFQMDYFFFPVCLLWNLFVL